MNRRALLKSLVAVSFVAITAVAPMSTNWHIVESTKSILLEGGAGKIGVAHVYYAVHPDHDDAIDLSDWGNRMPDNEELNRLSANLVEARNVRRRGIT